jgi:hypothetical protein
MSFDRKDIKYIPNKILNEEISDDSPQNISTDMIKKESEAVADRLLEHIGIINSYYDRLDSIDYLTKNAEILAKNPTYCTEKQEIIDAITAFGGTGKCVDFELFKKCVDMIIENYTNMVAISLTGFEI